LTVEVNVTVWPVVGLEGEEVKSAVSAEATVTVWLAVFDCVGVEESVTVNVTVNVPAVA